MAFTYVWCRLCNNHYLKYTMPFLDKQESWQKMLFTRVFRAPISFAITRRPCFCLVLQTHFLIAIFYCGWNVLSAARPSTRTSCKACKSNVSTCNAIMSYGTSKKKGTFPHVVTQYIKFEALQKKLLPQWRRIHFPTSKRHLMKVKAWIYL